jgi:hypothetical protein
VEVSHGQFLDRTAIGKYKLLVTVPIVRIVYLQNMLKKITLNNKHEKFPYSNRLIRLYCFELNKFIYFQRNLKYIHIFASESSKKYNEILQEIKMLLSIMAMILRNLKVSLSCSMNRLNSKPKAVNFFIKNSFFSFIINLKN